MMLNLGTPIVWLAASLILSIGATNFARLALAGRQAGLLAVRPDWPGMPALVWLLTSLFLLLLPLAAWRSGALSPYYLGLSGLDWVEGLAKGGSLILLVVGFTVFGWLIYRHAWPATRRRRGKWTTPIDIALMQWHWAFYRAAVIGWLLGPTNSAISVARPVGFLAVLQTQPVYWGAWLGLGLVVLEGALNPFTRDALRTPGWQERIVRNLAFAAATTALFVLTRNFWLCLLTHMAAEITVAWLVPGPER